jgi:hypothetical protein
MRQGSDDARTNANNRWPKFVLFMPWKALGDTDEDRGRSRDEGSTVFKV